MKNKDLIVGAQLCTKDGTMRTNAVIVKVEGGMFYVLSDYGNILQLAEEDLLLLYRLSDSWLYAHKHGYPFGTVKERLEQQILKLQESLETIKKWGA